MEKYGVGSRHFTNEGYEIEIVEKIHRTKRKIRFKSGCMLVVCNSAIKVGNIRNPYHPSLCGVGYLGIGRYKAKINRKTTVEYMAWHSMINRSYSKKIQEKHPTYKNVTVCEEWLNFQNFAKWYNENYPKVEGVSFHLDKDLLQQGLENKVYSPNTCCFLPPNVNSFLTNVQSTNSSGHIGASWHKRDKKWHANIRLFEEGKQKYLGYFNTIEEASITYKYARAIESGIIKKYLRDLNYLSEDIIKLIR